MYEIGIRKVTNGVIVTVGCMTFVETDTKKALSYIYEYLTNPEAAHKRWGKRVDESYEGLDEPVERCEPDRPRPDLINRAHRGYAQAVRGTFTGKDQG